jgi:3-phenylpropionate/trans-cinnamate dioxygenase ferredoxin component
MSLWIDVAPAESLPPGSCRALPTDPPVAVFNLGGQYYAIENNCTHEDADLAYGEVCGEEIVCPMHGARFSIVTGQVTAPPAYEDLRTFPVRLNDGMLQVDLGD